MIISSILKSIEFSASTNEQSSNLPKKSLEILLLEKNRALQSEQTQIKVAHADLESRLEVFNHRINMMTKVFHFLSFELISNEKKTDFIDLSIYIYIRITLH